MLPGPGTVVKPLTQMTYLVLRRYTNSLIP